MKKWMAALLAILVITGCQSPQADEEEINQVELINARLQNIERTLDTLTVRLDRMEAEAVVPRAQAG